MSVQKSGLKAQRLHLLFVIPLEYIWELYRLPLLCSVSIYCDLVISLGAYGGLGPMTNAILWVEFVIFSVFVGLRLYTRKEILNAVGPDDYLTVIALAVHILYTIFVTIATTYSLGRLFAEAEYPATYFTAVKYELFSQAAGLMSIGIGNWLSACFFFGSCRIKPRSGLSGCALRLLFPLLYSLPLRLLYSVCRLRRAGIQRCQDHVGWISPRLDILLDRGSSPPTSPLPFFRGSSFGS